MALTDDGKTAVVSNTLGKSSVWLVNFLNLSNECLMQRERGELIEFLSHDLRSPQVSILSLIGVTAAVEQSCG
ncbi:hypothetical protein [Formosimonas limnophila]|uniref:hypothetical protein n=1 Tax=Formosimonas limnophila TaxID=1384487 RepID=UPI001678BD20|nr:hypothetical protein [Formosimonas limnophila]